MADKLAVMFPGIGYHADKPLLYYSGKIAIEYGYEVIKLSFHDLPDNVFASDDKRAEAFDIALGQAEESLRSVDFSSFSEKIFISKSIGTGVAAKYSANHDLNVRNIYFTPLISTLEMMRAESGIVFHGTCDPWEEDTEGVKEICDSKKLPLHIVKGGNHSLETGSAAVDLPILMAVMDEVRKFILEIDMSKT